MIETTSASASILLIEDDSRLAHNISFILTAEGYQVQIAENGGSALTLLGNWRPDLILCDILMPGMDGYAVCEKLRKLPHGKDIPFIYISALGEYQQIRKGMALGADDYLSKPFSATDLLSAVSARLKRFAALAAVPSSASVPRKEMIRLQQLTEREKEILVLIGQGHRVKEIADRLCISPKTVEVHSSRLKKKLGVANAVMLVHWASQLDLSYRKGR